MNSATTKSKLNQLQAIFHPEIREEFKEIFKMQVYEIIVLLLEVDILSIDWVFMS